MDDTLTVARGRLVEPVAGVPSVFVGRGRELAELDGGLEDAISGRGRVFLLFGEAGVGKTRLADEISARARVRGVLPLWGRCWDDGDPRAYAPWLHIIRSFVAWRDSQDLPEESRLAFQDIPLIVPELGERLPPRSDPHSPPRDGSESSRLQLRDAVPSWLRHAAKRQPLLLVLDDLHEADPPSLQLLESLARDLRGTRLLIVGTYRDVEARRTPERSRILGGLAREGRYLVLRGLSEADVATFIAETTGFPPPEPVVREIHRTTEGNPFFVDETVRFLVAEGRLHNGDGLPAGSAGIPQALREAIRRRLEGLPGETREVLSVASVIGREFGLNPLERVCGLSAERLLEALAVAQSYDMVAEVPMALAQYRFSHVLVRETLYYEIPPYRRADLHRRSGEALEDLLGEDNASWLPSLAHHFVQSITIAGGDKAIAYCVGAAKRAARLGAHDEAAEHYRHALDALTFSSPVDEETRCELLLGLGEAERRSAGPSRARGTIEQSADLARKLGDSERFARAVLSLAPQPDGLNFVYRADAALIALLEEALQRTGRSDSELRARLLARLSVEHHFAGAGAVETPEPLGRQAIAMAERLGDPATRIAAWVGRYLSMLGPENLEERIQAVAEILRLAGEIGDREAMFLGHGLSLRNSLESGDVEALDGAIATCTTLAEGLRQPSFQWHIEALRTMRALADGRLEDADRLAHSTLVTGQLADCEGAVPVFEAQRYAQFFAKGHLGELETWVQSAAERFPWVVAWRAALALLYSELGREIEAKNEFERLAKREFTDLRRDANWYATTWFLSMTCAWLRDARRAKSLYELLLPFANRCFVGLGSMSLGSVSSILGLLAATTGSFAEAAAHFESALERGAESANLPFQAFTLVHYADMLLARDGPRDGDRALELLGRAIEIAETVGMGSLKLKAATLTCTATQRAYSKPRNRFQKTGDHWTISYETTSFHIKDSIGLRYLCYLLQNPGSRISAAKIALFAEGMNAESITTRNEDLADQGIHQEEDLGDAGEMLDSRAERAYKLRIGDLETELREAKAFHDFGRIETLGRERDFLLQQLSAGFGIQGRSRRAASFSERARLNVTRAIRSAIDRIADHSLPLAIHLRTSVATGMSCVYNPDPRSATSWIF